MRHVVRLFWFAMLAGFLAASAFMVSFFGVRDVSRHAATAPWLALLLLLCTPLLARAARGLLGPRSPAASALLVALIAPVIAAGALNELGTPLVYAHPPTCGTGRVMLEMSIPPLMFGVAAASALIAGALHARTSRRLRGWTLGFGAASLVLVAASIVRARLPDPDSFVQSVPVVAVVRAGSGAPGFPANDAVWKHQGLEGPGGIYNEPIGDVVLREACDAKRCAVALAAAETSIAETQWSWMSVRVGDTIRVRKDDSMWILQAWGERAYGARSLEPRDVQVSDVAKRVRPPTGWILSAALGLLFAGALELLRHRAAARRNLIAAGREGELDQSGAVSLTGSGAEGQRLRVAPGQALAIGPVVVLPDTLTPGGVYRGDGLLVGARILCGTRDELLEALTARMATLDAVALAAIVLTMAPLVASALVGIVF